MEINYYLCYNNLDKKNTRKVNIMKVLVTGTSEGIGKSIAQKFLNEGHEVIGIDINQATIEHKSYTHIQKNICDKYLPNIENIEILVNNAGVQDSGNDIDINLKGTIAITEKYGIQSQIKSIVFIASSSATTGSEFPEYVASKGGVVSYMKNVALRVAQYGATSNSISAGGVINKLNQHIIDDPNLWQQVLNETLLNKWASSEEIADFTYFISVINKSMTGQDIFIDNGEALKSNFIW